MIKYKPEYETKNMHNVLKILDNLSESHFKAVVFDLFETLITEWGHEKYTKSKMCADLGVDKDLFAVF